MGKKPAIRLEDRHLKSVRLHGRFIVVGVA
jgi:hypothetical protein